MESKKCDPVKNLSTNSWSKSPSTLLLDIIGILKNGFFVVLLIKLLFKSFATLISTSAAVAGDDDVGLYWECEG